jgi:hypothetical protein
VEGREEKCRRRARISGGELTGALDKLDAQIRKVCSRKNISCWWEIKVKKMSPESVSLELFNKLKT